MGIWVSMSREEKNAAIRTCVRAEMTASEIAVELHAPSRNAVIGHASRNKIKLLSPKEARARQEDRGPSAVRRDLDRAKSKIKRPSNSGKRDVKFALAEPEKKCAEYEYRGPVDIMGLTSETCRSPLWPDGIGKTKDRVKPQDIMYCGKQVREDSSYCRECHQRHFERIHTKTKAPGPIRIARR